MARSAEGRAWRRWASTVAAAGVDPRRAAAALKAAPSFRRQLEAYRQAWEAGPMSPPIEALRPMLADAASEAGELDAHYFLGDLLVARRIHQARPERHVDVGSRIDGFVAHLLTFMDVEVVDVRPLAADVPGLRFVQDDGMSLARLADASVPSLSSLHAIEHFGLGRYGDPVDPEGSARALAAFERVLAPGGTLYLSFPVGRPRVEFNAHRIFDPGAPLVASGLDLVRFDWIDDAGRLHEDERPDAARGQDYALGIYELRRR